MPTGAVVLKYGTGCCCGRPGIDARTLALTVAPIRCKCSRFAVWDFKLETGRVVRGLRPVEPPYAAFSEGAGIDTTVAIGPPGACLRSVLFRDGERYCSGSG